MPQLKIVLDFLAQLRQNNDREWFAEHKADYETAKLNFEAFVEDVIMNFSPVEDLLGLSPKDCTFRIYKDVRFSRDKSPYKTNFACVFGRGGRKKAHFPYYLHIQPGESFTGGGVYMPDAAQIKRIRQTIDEDPRALKAILAEKRFKKAFGEMDGEKLKTAPKGYPVDHPDLALLQHKQFLASHSFTDAEVAAPKFMKQFIDHCATLKPFLEYWRQLL